MTKVELPAEKNVMCSRYLLHLSHHLVLLLDLEVHDLSFLFLFLSFLSFLFLGTIHTHFLASHLVSNSFHLQQDDFFLFSFLFLFPCFLV